MFRTKEAPLADGNRPAAGAAGRPWTIHGERDDGGKLAEGIPLRRRQLIPPALREILHPAVIDDRNRQHPLASHSTVADDGIIGRRCRNRGEGNPPHDGGVGRIAVAVGVRIDNDQAVGKLTGHIGVVSSSPLGPILNTVTTGIAGQHRHNRIRGWIHDRDGGAQGIGGDHAPSIGADGRLNRQCPDRPPDLTTDRIIVGQQIDRFDNPLGLGIDDRDGAVQQIGHVGLLRIWRHGGGNRDHAGREDRIDGIVREIVLGGVGRKDVRRHHFLAVVAHPMGVWVTATDVDSSLNAYGHGSEFHDRVVIRCPVHRDVDLIRIDSGHHVGRRLAHGDIVQKLAGRSVEHRKLIVEPLRLINHGLIFIRPEIVRIVHVDAGKGDLSGRFPGLAADGSCRSRLGLASGFFQTAKSRRWDLVGWISRQGTMCVSSPSFSGRTPAAGPLTKESTGGKRVTAFSRCSEALDGGLTD